LLDGFGIDDVAITTQKVPESTTWLLAASGSVALWAGGCVPRKSAKRPSARIYRRAPDFFA